MFIKSASAALNFPCSASPCFHRLGLALLLEVERLRGLPALLLRLHRAVRRGHVPAAGFALVRGDAGLPGRDVRGHAGPPAAAAERAQSLHQRHEVQVL